VRIIAGAVTRPDKKGARARVLVKAQLQPFFLSFFTEFRTTHSRKFGDDLQYSSLIHRRSP
jgi:hypothetical protein